MTSIISRRPTSTFISVAAQPDNLGDIEIRSIATNWLKSSDQRLVVYTGKMPPEYIESYSFRDTDQLISSAYKYQFLLVRDCIFTGANLFFSPGPQSFRKGKHPLVRLKANGKSLANLFNTVLAKMTGGKVISIGRSVRSDDAVYLKIERARFRLSDIYTVRDNVTSAYLNADLEQSPDLAFYRFRSNHLGPISKQYFTISLRGDSTIDTGTLEAIIRVVSLAGLVPVFVTQVKSDQDQHERFSRLFNLPHVGWPNNISFVEQRDRVNHLYSESRFVFSNRLHSLIFGCQQNAQPIVYRDRYFEKIESTLSWIFPLRTFATLDDLDSLESLMQANPNQCSIAPSAVKAKRLVDALEIRVRTLLSIYPEQFT